MMIFEIIGQRLVLSSPLVVEGSIDYLTAEFNFHDEDWRTADDIWAHFEQNDKRFQLQVKDNRIEKSAHLNLDRGYWKVYLHASSADGERITTNQVDLLVEKTGTMDGEVLPEIPLSAAEQISITAAEARQIAQSVRDDADAGEFDGYSPTVDVSEITDGHNVLITDKDGEKTFDVMDGYSPNIVVTEVDGGHRVFITQKDGTMRQFEVMDGYTPQKGIDYKDGVSPVVSVTDTTDGHEVSVTDANGTETFEVKDGDKGDTGFSPIVSAQEMDGYTNVLITDSTHTETIKVMDGADGYSPLVETAEFEGGHTVKITDKNGLKTFNVMNGKDGRDGNLMVPAPTKFEGLMIPSADTVSDTFNCMAYGSGRFVLLGRYEGERVVLTTADFVTFKKTVLTTDYRKLKYVGGKFFLIGRLNESGSSIAGNTFMVSENGENWTEYTLPASTYWTDIEYGDGYYVAISGAVGNTNNLSAYSTDLTTWTQITLPSADAWQAIRYGNGHFVAITYTGTAVASLYPGSNMNWFSAGSLGEGIYFDIYFDNGNFYIPIAKNWGESTNQIRVGDVLDFDIKYLPVAAQWECMAFGAGYGVVFAHTSDGLTKVQDACYTDDGGETWEHIDMPVKTMRISAAYGRNMFVSLGQDRVEICNLWDNL